MQPQVQCPDLWLSIPDDAAQWLDDTKVKLQKERERDRERARERPAWLIWEIYEAAFYLFFGGRFGNCHPILAKIECRQITG